MGVQQKKDVYKISHDFKINTTANKNTHFTLISPVDIKISYFLRFRCKIIFKISTTSCVKFKRVRNVVVVESRLETIKSFQIVKIPGLHFARSYTIKKGIFFSVKGKIQKIKKNKA